MDSAENIMDLPLLKASTDENMSGNLNPDFDQLKNLETFEDEIPDSPLEDVFREQVSLPVEEEKETVECGEVEDEPVSLNDPNQRKNGDHADENDKESIISDSDDNIGANDDDEDDEDYRIEDDEDYDNSDDSDGHDNNIDDDDYDKGNKTRHKSGGSNIKTSHVKNVSVLDAFTEESLLVYQDHSYADLNKPVPVSRTADAEATLASPSELAEEEPDIIVIDTQLYCILCKSAFNDRISLYNHQKLHKIKCYICGESFDHWDALLVHETLHQMTCEQRFVCGMCETSFPDESVLSTHIDVHHRASNKTLECKLCERQLNGSQSIRTHWKLHERMVKTRECVICQTEYKNWYLFFQHIRIHQKVEHTLLLNKPPSNILDNSQLERLFKCGKCTCSFPSQCGMVMHAAFVHTYRASVICCVCSEKFDTKEALENHISQSHNQVVHLLCESCGTEFTNEVEYHMHMQSMHAKNRKCLTCYKMFDSKESLLAHCSEQHPHIYQCEFCKRVFHSRLVKRDHIKRIHKRYMPYRCIVCHRGYKTKESLRLHTYNYHPVHRPPVGGTHHWGEGGKVNKFLPYICSICKKGYSTRTGLHGHLKQVHDSNFRKDGILPGDYCYVCDLCDMKFFSSSGLKQHKTLVHKKDRKKRGVKSHRTTSTTRNEEDNESSSNLSDTEESHPPRDYFCALCKREFSSKQALVRHVGHAHKNHPDAKFVGKCFKQPENEEEMASAISTGGDYLCELCQKGFPTRQRLCIHVCVAHKDRQGARYIGNNFRVPRDEEDLKNARPDRKRRSIQANQKKDN